ncbi:MAG TPA: ribbon-helix-helix protein, CopG family [Thermoanaerobaculia bacterium]
MSRKEATLASRTVRLDEDTEEILDQLVKETGLSISAVFKEGILALRDRMAAQPTRSAYDIYRELDLGPGGYASAPATETRSGAREAIRRAANLLCLRP